MKEYGDLDMEEKVITKGLNGNQLKLIAIIAMTLDHLIWVIFPGYRTEWWIVGCHILGRLTAPIMWFFIAEGYHYTKNVKKYILRLFGFALISHFAYNFCFGIPFIPFQTTIFNQTSVLWSLAWAVVGLAILDHPKIKGWMKTVLIILIDVIAFCSDWSCIAVMAILTIASNRGNFKKQMQGMMFWVLFYALVYFIFIDKVYGIVQLFVGISIPFLKAYNGQRGSWKGMKWLFYVYYPVSLALCGIIRLLLHGDVDLLIGS